LKKECGDIKENYNKRGAEIISLDQEIDKLKNEIKNLNNEKNNFMKKIVEMEDEITTLENFNRQLECRGYDFECKFYSTLEEKLLNDKEYEHYISDKNDMIERLTFDIEEIRREIDTKDDIIRKLKRQMEVKEVKTSIFNNLYEESSDNNNINLTPIMKNRNSDNRFSKALLNVENLENLNKDCKNGFENISRMSLNAQQMNLSNKNSQNKLENKNNDSFNNDNNGTSIINIISNNNNINNNNNNNNYLSVSNINNENANNEHNISEINEQNKSNIFNSKNSKTYAKDDFHDLNVQAISAKIDDVLNNSLKDYNLNLLDKSLNINNNERNSSITNNNTPVNNKLNSSNDENEEKEFIKQIIDQEVKNILENRRLFILSTLTQENFSFDFANSKIQNASFDLSNNIKKKIPNKAKIIENIDEILLKIQARREKVLNQKKLMMNKLEKMGIKIF